MADLRCISLQVLSIKSLFVVFCRKNEDLQLEDILRTSSHDLLYLDTYALRNLVYASPECVRVLSSMQVAADKFLQRCAIVAPSGEECVLTFTLSLQEAMDPQ
jgi:hypothetical protein